MKAQEKQIENTHSVQNKKVQIKQLPTTSLLNRLDNHSITKENLEEYINDTKDAYPNTHIFSDYIADTTNNMTAAKIIHNCAGFISRSYAYDILNGSTNKHPGRDILLILCISAHMERKMIRRVLETYDHRELYLKDPRDLIIATYINNKNFDLSAINDELYKYNLPLLPAT